MLYPQLKGGCIKKGLSRPSLLPSVKLEDLSVSIQDLYSVFKGRHGEANISLLSSLFFGLTRH